MYCSSALSVVCIFAPARVRSFVFSRHAQFEFRAKRSSRKRARWRCGIFSPPFFRFLAGRLAPSSGDFFGTALTQCVREFGTGSTCVCV